MAVRSITGDNGCQEQLDDDFGAARPLSCCTLSCLNHQSCPVQRPDGAKPLRNMNRGGEGVDFLDLITRQSGLSASLLESDTDRPMHDQPLHRQTHAWPTKLAEMQKMAMLELGELTP